MDKNEVMKWLKRRGTRRTVEGLPRYGIEAKHAFGVTMGALLSLRKRLGKDHALSLALWESGWYEARLLAALIGDPQRVTRRQMNAWAASFENWGDCDTVCFHLFERTPFAWEKVRQWSGSPRPFVKRGAFALMACLALHDKAAPDKSFLPAGLVACLRPRKTFAQLGRLLTLLEKWTLEIEGNLPSVSAVSDAVSWS